MMEQQKKEALEKIKKMDFLDAFNRKYMISKIKEAEDEAALNRAIDFVDHICKKYSD